MTVRQVADKLASFVAKNGRQFENITRQRNPGDTPFKFLFDKHCPDYRYYEFRLAEEEKILAQSKEAEASRNANNASSKAPIGLHRSSFEQKPSYQTPASALYGAYEGSSSQGSSSSYGKIYIVSLSFSNIIWQLSLCLSTVFTWLLIVWLSLKLIQVWHFNCMLSL